MGEGLVQLQGTESLRESPGAHYTNTPALTASQDSHTGEGRGELQERLVAAGEFRDVKRGQHNSQADQGTVAGEAGVGAFQGHGSSELGGHGWQGGDLL